MLYHSLNSYEKRQVVKKALFAKQWGKCAVCHNEFKLDELDLEHDHTNDQIRGLVCRHCNLCVMVRETDPHSNRISVKSMRWVDEYLRAEVPVLSQF